MDNRPRSGFREISHTADWALQIWAPDFSGLLIQAAVGMNDLMGVVSHQSPRRKGSIDFLACDAESALVGFLNEILFQMEETGLVFDRYAIHFEGERMRAEIEGAPILRIEKPIKAVTFHNLTIQKIERGLEAIVVFDV